MNALQVLTSPAERESIIMVLKSIHHDLMKCVHAVNVIFAFPTMLCFGITFLFTLFTLFASYKTFFYHDTDLNIALSSIYWTIFYNYFLLGIIVTCNLVDSEADKLATLIYKMMNKNISSSMAMQAFGNQVKQISGKSSCGLFNFDYSLIMMVSELRNDDSLINLTIFFRPFPQFLNTSSFSCSSRIRFRVN